MCLQDIAILLSRRERAGEKRFRFLLVLLIIGRFGRTGREESAKEMDIGKELTRCLGGNDTRRYKLGIQRVLRVSKLRLFLLEVCAERGCASQKEIDTDRAV